MPDRTIVISKLILHVHALGRLSQHRQFFLHMFVLNGQIQTMSKKEREYIDVFIKDILKLYVTFLNDKNHTPDAWVCRRWMGRRPSGRRRRQSQPCTFRTRCPRPERQHLHRP